MGPFDREILDYVDAFATDSCSLDNLLEHVKGIIDYDEERSMNDIQNLIDDGLLILDKDNKTIQLTDKAKRPAVPLPKNHH